MASIGADLSILTNKPMIWLIPESTGSPQFISGLEDLEGIEPLTVQFEDCPPEMTPEELNEVQARFEQEVRVIQFQRFETAEDFFAAIKAVGDKYAKQYPEWASWAEEIRETAIG